MRIHAFLSAILIFLLQVPAFSQTETGEDLRWKSIYRETPEKIFSLKHTRLEASFDIPNARMDGKVWISLNPHFYNQDSLLLDAKGMKIREVSIVKGTKKNKLNYAYDQKQLNIRLDRSYSKEETLTIYIDYTALPNEWKTEGSAAITDAKGLYFINPKGEEKNKPTQFWTQGETEATSVWCPTIDRPNQKTTNEILMRVPSKWVTLSNGKLIKQTINADGTRTDHWKMEQPHAPYLFFMGAGEMSVVKDNWKGKEVSYYVEKEYASVARKIFGNTPEMMTYFSKITGVEYPWIKYAQFVGRDFVSGAMENTTATLHQESAQQDARELLDGNRWEGTIAHELFHQWFGDLVTTESWSNLTVNESFANYSEYLWDEYKYGKDKADATNYEAMAGYLQSGSEEKNLVRFYYSDKEDMFDAVSYNKGGRILHMLRNYIGDSAFFRSLNVYMKNNQFKAAEAHQLRLAFEEVTGKDLNWFFNQWYYGSGHPDLDITYSYDSSTMKASVIVRQLQKEKIFRFPVAIDLYNGQIKSRYNVWVNNQADTFHFTAQKKPDLINFDGEKILLCTKKENKTVDEYIHQYKYAGKYLDRLEAIEFLSKRQTNTKALEQLTLALNDPFSELRREVLGKLDMKKANVVSASETVILKIAESDPDRRTKAKAIQLLGQLKKPAYKTLYEKALNDSSYSVSGSALGALQKIDEDAALKFAKTCILDKPKGSLLESAASLLISSGDTTAFNEITTAYSSMGLSQSKFNMTGMYAMYLGNIMDSKNLMTGVDAIVDFRNAIPEQYGVGPVIDNILKGIITKKETLLKSSTQQEAILNEQIKYIKGKLQK